MASDRQRQEALERIAGIAERYHITADEVAAYLSGDHGSSRRNNDVVTRVLAWLGGLFVFAGLCIYTGLQWAHLGPGARIVIILGPGVAAYVLALLCARHSGYGRAVTPLMLVAALFQTTGMLVAIAEFSRGGDPRHAVLVVLGVMLVQSALTFWQLRRGVVLFLSVLFAAVWLALGLDLLAVESEWSALVVGLSLLVWSRGIGKTRFQSVCGPWYFLGSALFLAGGWRILDDWQLTVVFIAPAVFFVFLSALVRSRALLFNGIVAVLVFIGYYTAEYFADSTAWPLGLLLMGFVLVGMSRLALQVHRQYIR